MSFAPERYYIARLNYVAWLRVGSFADTADLFALAGVSREMLVLVNDETLWHNRQSSINPAYSATRIADPPAALVEGVCAFLTSMQTSGSVPLQRITARNLAFVVSHALVFFGVAHLVPLPAFSRFCFLTAPGSNRSIVESAPFFVGGARGGSSAAGAMPRFRNTTGMRAINMFSIDGENGEDALLRFAFEVREARERYPAEFGAPPSLSDKATFALLRHIHAEYEWSVLLSRVFAHVRRGVLAIAAAAILFLSALFVLDRIAETGANETQRHAASTMSMFLRLHPLNSRDNATEAHLPDSAVTGLGALDINSLMTAETRRAVQTLVAVIIVVAHAGFAAFFGDTEPCDAVTSVAHRDARSGWPRIGLLLTLAIDNVLHTVLPAIAIAFAGRVCGVVIGAVLFLLVAAAMSTASWVCSQAVSLLLWGQLTAIPSVDASIRDRVLAQFAPSTFEFWSFFVTVFVVMAIQTPILRELVSAYSSQLATPPRRSMNFPRAPSLRANEAAWACFEFFLLAPQVIIQRRADDALRDVFAEKTPSVGGIVANWLAFAVGSASVLHFVRLVASHAAEWWRRASVRVKRI